MIASWNSGGRISKAILVASLAQFAFVAVSGGDDPQQCERAAYWKFLPCVSMSLTGEVLLPTSMRRLGGEKVVLHGNLQAVCLGFPMQPCIQRRMKLNVSSDPELIGI
jgi:hypothetical protein